MKSKYRIEHVDKHYYVSRKFLIIWLFEIDPKTGWPMQFNSFGDAQKYIDDIETIDPRVSAPSLPKPTQWGRILTETVHPMGYIPELPKVPESLQQYLKNKDKQV